MNDLKKKFLINVLVALAVVLAFLFVGADYLLKEIETSSAQIVADKQSAYAQERKNERLEDSQGQYEDMQSMLDEALSSVIGKDDTVVFIEEVERVASEDKVKLKIRKTDSKAAGEGEDFITYSNFNFIAGGQFEQVMHFLGKMENFKYSIEISNVKMSFDDFDQFNKDMVILTFDAKLYQKNEQK